MQAQVQMPNESQGAVTMSFEDFLYSGPVHRESMVAMCEPGELITDHLPAFDSGDPEEIRQAFAEACEQSCDHAFSKIELDEYDVAYIRTHFLHSRYFRRVTTGGFAPVPA